MWIVHVRRKGGRVRRGEALIYGRRFMKSVVDASGSGE